MWNYHYLKTTTSSYSVSCWNCFGMQMRFIDALAIGDSVLKSKDVPV